MKVCIQGETARIITELAKERNLKPEELLEQIVRLAILNTVNG